MSDALSKIGFSVDRKNLKLVSQLDICKIVPVIDHCFINEFFTWGDNPVLRWATNNTTTIRYGRDEGPDKGSFFSNSLRIIESIKGICPLYLFKNKP